MLLFVHISPEHCVSGTDSKDSSCFPDWVSYPNNERIVIVTNMESWSLVGKGTSHSEGRRRSVEVGTRLGAGVAAEGVVAELVSKLRSLVCLLYTSPSPRDS